VPKSARPTSARVREALFSIVGHDLSGVRVLDAFGGSGLLGLEAWSRGAEVTIVERDRRAVRTIRANASGLGAEIRILHADLQAVADRLQPFELVLADPPYAMDPDPLVPMLAPLVGGRLVLETDKDSPIPAAGGGLALQKSRTYGGTRLSIFSRG